MKKLEFGLQDMGRDFVRDAGGTDVKENYDSKEKNTHEKERRHAVAEPQMVRNFTINHARIIADKVKLFRKENGSWYGLEEMLEVEINDLGLFPVGEDGSRSSDSPEEAKWFSHRESGDSGFDSRRPTNLEQTAIAREWLIEWNSKRKLHPSQDTCVASLAALLVAAHAAEQPKLTLTEEQVQACVKWFPSGLAIDYFATTERLNRLLTSPVAPPPPIAQQEQRCFWCNTLPSEAAARHEGPHLTWCVHFREEQRGGIPQTPPVAPGEQPQCSGKDWFCSQPGCDKLHSEHSAQERVSDELIMRAYTAWVSGAQKVYDEFKEIRATAAKQARKEALDAAYTAVWQLWNKDDKNQSLADALYAIRNIPARAALPSPQKKEEGK